MNVFASRNHLATIFSFLIIIISQKDKDMKVSYVNKRK